MTEQRPLVRPDAGEELLPAVPNGGGSLSLALFPAGQDAGDHRAISRQQAMALIAWSERYGLDAWAGHTCYMYGRPYVRVEGALYLGRSRESYRGYSVSPMGPTDRTLHGYGEHDVVYECIVDDRVLGLVVREVGAVTEMERDLAKLQCQVNAERDLAGKGTTPATLEMEVLRRRLTLPILRNPAQQAETRAIRRAHLRAYPLEGYQDPERT